jgi:hypothetical protein
MKYLVAIEKFGKMRKNKIFEFKSNKDRSEFIKEVLVEHKNLKYMTTEVEL